MSKMTHKYGFLNDMYSVNSTIQSQISVLGTSQNSEFQSYLNMYILSFLKEYFTIVLKK